MKWILLALLFSLDSIATTEGSRILALFPVGFKSHINAFSPIVEALASQDHDVTFISNYMGSPEVARSLNVKSIILDDVGVYVDGMTSSFNKNSANGVLSLLMNLGELYQNSCHKTWNDSQMKVFLNNSGNYDVVLLSSVFNHCFMALATKFKAPIVLVSPNMLIVETAWKLDVPFPLAYLPMIFLTYHSPMTFSERLHNVVAAHAYQLFDRYFERITHQAVLQYMPEALSSSDIVGSVSLVLTNSHISLHESRPSMPYVIDVGGMHCRPGQKLPKELETFIAESNEEGFILFSLGSLLQGQSLSDDIIEKFRKVFSRIKPRVIWKFEKKLEGLSNNTMISTWLPQQDLVAHPNCRLVMTHGGLLSLQEVVYHGVPLLGFPQGADRDYNMRMAINKGFAQSLDIIKSTEDEIVDAIDQILENESYSIKAKEISSLTRDRPQTPKESAIYWIQYVIRHKGAPHLKSGAYHLNIFQYLLVDVYATLSLIFVFCISSLVLLLTIIWRVCCYARKVVYLKKKIN